MRNAFEKEKSNIMEMKMRHENEIIKINTDNLTW